LRAGIEAWLDFAPEELRAEDEAKLVERLESCATRLRKASGLAQRSLPLFEPPIVLLAGPVNAGKSSLFNALVGSDRALVSAEAGTTRDWIEVDLALPAGRIRLRDSAGLRAAAGAVEAAGIERALALQNEADLVLWCLGPDQNDEPPEAALCLRTKADLDPNAQVSASSGAGVEELLQKLSERLFSQVTADSETGVITSKRQLQLLNAAAERCYSALVAMSDSALEFAASDLRGAAEALAELTGTQEPDELMLDALFSQFCLGK
jgi:tRNA modification GTPase